MKGKLTLNNIKNNYLIHSKQTKGITLISLVITIIVLMIMAGVSTLIVMNNGIIEKSDEAKEKSQTADVKERLSLMWSDCQTEYYSNGGGQSKEDFFTQDLLNEKIGTGVITDFKYTEDSKITFVYTDENGKRYYVELGNEVILYEDNASKDDLKDWNGCTTCSEENPHIITNKYEFESIRTHINTDENGNQYIGGYFKLGNDIYFNASDFEENGDFYNNGIGFITFGTDGSNDGYNAKSISCRLVFDGNGYGIYNLSMNYSQGSQFRTGIFSRIEKGEVKNLKLDNCSMYAPTCGALIVRILDKGAEIKNIQITNSNVEFWKALGSMDYTGFLVGQLYGNVENITINNCSLNSKSWFSGIIAAGIGESAIVSDINVNEFEASSYVESGLLAYQVSEAAQLSNINIQNTEFTYTHSDINRSGILINKSLGTEEKMPVLQNSNISVIYNGTVRTLVTTGLFKIKDSEIEVIHNTEKDNMEITAGPDVIIENSEITYKYLKNDQK